VSKLINMMNIRNESAWRIQFSVIYALVFRELNSRFGRYRLGYMWALLEPLAFIGVLSGIRVLFGRSSMGGVEYPLFFASGIMPYLLFQHILISSMNAVEANRGVFNYQRVKPVDCVIARVAIEGIIYGLATCIILPALYLLGFTFSWNDTVSYILTVALLIIFATGLGLVMSVIAPLWQESKKIVPIAIRPLFFVSGIFFVLSDMPERAKAFLLINPLLHAIELIRHSMFAEYQVGEVNVSYLFICSLVSLVLGLSVYRIYRLDLVTSGNIR